MQCAAVSTTRGAMTDPPQKCDPDDDWMDTMNGNAVVVVGVPPTMRSVASRGCPGNRDTERRSCDASVTRGSHTHT
jgi:hypothetical protein